MVCVSQFTRQNDMTIQDTADSIGNWFVGIVTLYQHGVNTSDGTAFKIAASLQ